MAMLAEPRRKQKVVNLRGDSSWSKDSSKFGQRMLERMGWAPGKGLGAREDGATAHVVARYKNDDHGLGYNDRNDQWTRHEDSFESLLAGLRSDEPAAPPEHVPASLEQKSKKSRARVHYHKFTRGKDITRYSEKDLASIFGKKSLKDGEAKSKKDHLQHIGISEDIDEEQPQQMFKCGGNMADYFTSKLRALGRSELSTTCPSPSESITLQDLAQKENNLDDVHDLPQIKKKKKKRHETEDNVQNGMVISQDFTKIDNHIQKKKKKKKCDADNHIEHSVKDECDLLNCGDIKRNKKKKSNVIEEIAPWMDDGKHNAPQETLNYYSDYKTQIISEALNSDNIANKVKKKKSETFDQQHADGDHNLLKKKKRRHKNVL